MTRLANCRRLHGVACTVLRGVLIFASVVAAADGNVALYTSAIDRSAGHAGILVVPDTAKDLDAAAAGARKAGRKFYVAFAVNEIFGQKGKKAPHPERCVGVAGKDPPHAPWCALDFAHPAVREEFASRVAKAVRKVSPDGVLLDFMRLPVLFKTVAAGGTASAREKGMLTDMVRRIRRDLDASSAEGVQRALVVRVPDSAAYASGIGIDLEAWLAEKGLVDAFAAGGPFQLNDWKVSAALSARHGVPFWAALESSGMSYGNDSDSGAFDDELLPRQCVETYRARLVDVARAKPAVILYVDSRSHRLSKDCILPLDAEALADKSKRYFVTYRNTKSIGHYLAGGTRHLTLPSLVASHPVPIANGLVKYPVCVYERNCPAFELTVQADIPSGMQTAVFFNGKALKQVRRQAGYQAYELPPSAVKHGANEVIVKASGRNARGQLVKLRNIAVDAIR